MSWNREWVTEREGLLVGLVVGVAATLLAELFVAGGARALGAFGGPAGQVESSYLIRSADSTVSVEMSDVPDGKVAAVVIKDSAGVIFAGSRETDLKSGDPNAVVGGLFCHRVGWEIGWHIELLLVLVERDSLAEYVLFTHLPGSRLPPSIISELEVQDSHQVSIRMPADGAESRCD